MRGPTSEVSPEWKHMRVISKHESNGCQTTKQSKHISVLDTPTREWIGLILHARSESSSSMDSVLRHEENPSRALPNNGWRSHTSPWQEHIFGVRWIGVMDGARFRSRKPFFVDRKVRTRKIFVSVAVNILWFDPFLVRSCRRDFWKVKLFN